MRPDRQLLDDAWWNELLFDEHTWTFVGATTQAEDHQSDEQTVLKGARVERARNDITESIQREWAQLEALVRAKDASVAVFNSLNWTRSGIVETDIPEGMTLVDSVSGKDVPVEILFVGKGIHMPGFGPRSMRVRFMAANVPAIGYKLFTLKPGGRRPSRRFFQANIREPVLPHNGRARCRRDLQHLRQATGAGTGGPGKPVQVRSVPLRHRRRRVSEELAVSVWSGLEAARIDRSCGTSWEVGVSATDSSWNRRYPACRVSEHTIHRHRNNASQRTEADPAHLSATKNKVLTPSPLTWLFRLLSPIRNSLSARKPPLD